MRAFVSIDATFEKLNISVQEVSRMTTWRASFDAHILEQISYRTGSPKQYSDFAQMIVKAVKGTDPNTFLDLLGRKDLSLIIG
jgi:hypothetical protein